MRCAMLFSVVLLSTLVGCTGNKELPPDASKVKQVDPADIQKQIQEGMQKGGGTRQPTLPSAPAGEAPAAPATPAPSN